MNSINAISKCILFILVCSINFLLISCNVTRPEDSVKAFLDSIALNNTYEAAEHIDKTNELPNPFSFDDMLYDGMTKRIYPELSYEIIDTHIDKNTAKVSTNITTLDLVNIFTHESDKLPQYYFRDNDLFTYLNLKLDSLDIRKDHNIDIELKKAKGIWLIQLNDELRSVLTGEYKKAIDDLMMILNDS